MRVGIFTDAYLPDINGVVSSIVTLQKSLEKLGHEVYIITTRPYSDKEEMQGHIYRLAGIELKSLYGYVMTSPFHYAALEKIKIMNLDVIHVQTEFGVGIFARIASNKLSIPLVCTYHTMYEDYTNYVNIFNSKTVEKIAKKATHSLSKLYGDKCTALIVPSEKTKERMLSYGIRKEIHVIPTGLDLDNFNPKNTSLERKQAIRQQYHIQPDDFFLIYVGRVAPEKSIDFIISSFTEIKRQQQKIKLLVVGDGPGLDDLKKLATSLELDDYIRFAGRVPHDDVPAYYHSADGFTSASLSETQGMTFIEAMASGCVIFARPDAVLEDLVIEDETGYLATTEAEYSQKLISFTNSSVTKKKQMSQKAIKLAGKYDSKLFGESVLAVYQEAIDIYQKTYQITKIKVHQNNVELELELNEDKFKIEISLDEYFAKKYQKGQNISQKELEALRNNEEYAKAYNSCIRKLAIKDRTTKEIYDYLTKETNLDIKQVNQIVDILCQKRYLNDQQYMMTQIESMHALTVGKNKIIRSLVKKGIPQADIENVLAKEDNEAEINRGLKWAIRQQNRIKDQSLLAKKQNIQQKLLLQGYSIDNSKEIISRMSFSADEAKEKEIIVKDYQKAITRYQNKYQGSELRNRVYRYLKSKGYTNENINSVIEKVE